jgi:hypothetical protein
MADGNSIAPFAQAYQQAGLAYQATPVAKPPSVWDSYRAALAPIHEAPTQLQSAVAGVRHGLESAAVGALLGFIEGKLGTLDLAGKYPVDGIAGLILLVLSVKDAGAPNGYASDLRAISQSCMSVAAFRMSSKWAKGDKEPMSRHNTMPGETDPLVAASKKYL